MSHVIADRVKETTATTGNGSLALSGAAVGFRAFSSVCANNDTVDYVISSIGGAEWEIGVGTWQTGNTLVRTTVRQSSNGGSAVSFSGGTKDVYIDINAARFTRPVSAFLDVSLAVGSQVLTQAGGFTKVTGFSVNNDPGSDWNSGNQWYVVPVAGIYLVQTLLRLQDASPSGKGYGHGAATALGDFPGFLWSDSSSSTNARNGQINVRQAHFNAGDTVLVEAFWDYVTTGATIDSCRMTISLMQADQ
jgi:hypothetical protein